MTEKRLIVDEDYNIVDTVTGEWLDDNQMFDLVNKLHKEKEQLKQELRIYRKIANCRNCEYHDYDEFSRDDGSYDEFEVCRKGNDVTEGICEEWREL